MVLTKIPEKEHKERIESVRQTLRKRKLDALYITGATSFIYLTGFSYIATERPAALIIPEDGPITFMGPVIERDHIRLETRLIEDIKTYFDYPGESHPMDHFVAFLRGMRLAKARIGIDNPAGAAGIWGYRGPKISEKLKSAKFVPAKKIVEDMRIIKSENEVELMRESAKWANLAHGLLQKYTEPGVWDADVAMQATREASVTMKNALGPDYVPFLRRAPASSNYRGQVGEMSAIPHALNIPRTIRRGDVLVTGAGADLGGYSSELERTMIVGRPSSKQRKYFEIMLRTQQAALHTYAPGRKCSDVDKAARKVLLKAGCGNLMRHHTGHGMGLEGHEPPWLDIGDNTVLKPGMIFSCEPGIYIPGYAGFRHSDTVAITEDGAEVLTYYPRDLESLTIA